MARLPVVAGERWWGTVAALVAAASLASACGARLSDAEMRSATAGERGVAAPASVGGTGAAEGAGGAPAEVADDASAGPASGGATPDAPSAPDAPGATVPGTGASGPGDAATTTLPPGGNGGATDTGVTADELRLGLVTTLTGAIPGLFRGAALGAQAWAAYQNSQGGLFGRRIQMVVGDDRLSADDNRAQVIRLQEQVFAFVGSFSVYDDAGADEMRRSGVPDVGYGLGIRRFQLPNNFSPQPLPNGWRLGSLEYYKRTYPDAIRHVGAIVGNIESPRRSWLGMKAAMERLGYEIVYERYNQPTETDFTADVVQMCGNRDVRFLVIINDYATIARIARQIVQQGCRDRILVPQPIASAYDPRFIQAGGSAVDGYLIDQQLALFGGEDGAVVPEVALLNRWVKRIDPKATPDIYAAFSWAAGRLFAQAHAKAGPRVTRASLLAALRTIDDFDSFGLVAPAGPASKRPPTCWLLIKVEKGRFTRATPGSGYRCDDGGFFRL